MKSIERLRLNVRKRLVVFLILMPVLCVNLTAQSAIPLPTEKNDSKENVVQSCSDTERLLELGVVGNSQELYELGRLYEEGVQVPRNERKAFQAYLQSGRMNNIDGIRAVGQCYRWGIGVKINERIAFHWFQRGAKAKDPASPSSPSPPAPPSHQFSQSKPRALPKPVPKAPRPLPPPEPGPGGGEQGAHPGDTPSGGPQYSATKKTFQRKFLQ